ncbi:MAG: Maf family nucleotide pyrophosphatase [Lachnospiraceae bacterium]|nr:Maf family nucleotide pyrophosphatase [Lachnospiraceae bacterium]
METVKLYYDDSMIRTFKAKVESCETVPDKDGLYRVVLNETAFFPEGGGQECDTGTITCGDITANVIHVSEESDGIITHLTDKALEAGSAVTGTLDWDKRFSNMQHHTAEHIMSGIIKKLFDKDNVGFHLRSGSTVFDIAGTFTDDELCLIEDTANKAVTDNIEIITKFISGNELSKTPCRSKFYDEGNALSPGAEQTSLPSERSARNLLPLPDKIRIVDITGVDTCACCAPHVKTTGCIGLIKIMNAEHFRGGTRFTIVCGAAALKSMRRLRMDELEIMHLLSAKEGDTPAKVKQQCDALSAAKQSIYAKDETIAEILMKKASADGSRIFFCPDIDQNTARRCVNSLTGQSEKPSSSPSMGHPADTVPAEAAPVFFFTGNDEKGYRFIIGGGNDARVLLSGLKEKIDIKGGGNSAMVSGTTSASEKEIRNAAAGVLSLSKGPRLILASASPRRREILAKLGIPFEVMVSGANETSATKDPSSLVKELAMLKAKDVFSSLAGSESVIVIGSDTVVDLDGSVLGKPHSADEAVRMLGALSGRSHKVHTGIAVIVRNGDGETSVYSESEVSTVTFDSLSQNEINAYIASGEPFDKAGSYAIQGLFAPYISSIEGDYYNIVGLPLRRLYRIISPYYT